MHVLAAPPFISQPFRDASVAPSSLEFRQVYDTHFRFAWRVLRRLGVREADLMDMTQNVFVVVHRKLPGFEGRSEITTWLFGICRRVAIDYRRSARIRREVPADAHQIASLPGPEPASDAPDKARLAALAETLLDRLPEKLRVVFVLFELDEMSGDDIAALLDIPVGTVRSRLRLAREAFQREAARLERGGMTRSEVFR
jgi:RNA polymerase sigma-70 factor (ECF subfamily)